MARFIENGGGTHAKFPAGQHQASCYLIGPAGASTRRSLISRNAEVVCHAAMPKGLDNSISPGRNETFLSVVSTFTIFSLSIHTSILRAVTRSRIRYQRFC